jgi:lipopolysaccharide transport system ATP-binding protein
MAYLRGAGSGTMASTWRNNRDEYHNDYFVPERLEVTTAGSDRCGAQHFSNRDPIEISVTGIVHQPDPALNVGIAVYAEEGELLFWTFTTDEVEERWPLLKAGRVRLQVRLPARTLNEGTYRVELLASLHCRAWLLEPGGSAPSVMFSIRGGLSDSPYWDQKRPGIFGPVLSWDVVDECRS